MFSYAEPEQKKAAKDIIQKKEPADSPAYSNRTGIPDDMKARFENMSGFSFEDVRVHHNSEKPAQLQSLAYTQGNQVYVAPGQERHLEHELGHVVQQKQGRVKPTGTVRGLAVNNDAALEREADLSAGRTMSGAAPETHTVSDVIQGVFVEDRYVEGSTIKEIISNQENNQKDENYKYSAFLTVGFEHEFAQLSEPGVLKDITHVKLAESSKEFKFSGLRFSLETDADNAIELVSPPFIMEPVSAENLVPRPKDVQKVDDEIKRELVKVAEESGKIEGMISKFSSYFGVDFTLIPAKIFSSNINPTSDVSARTGANKDPKITGHKQIEKDSYKELKIKLSSKISSSTIKTDRISGQMNISADAKTYDAAKKIFTKAPEGGESAAKFLAIEDSFGAKLLDVAGGIAGADVELTSEMKLFLRELSTNISQAFAIYSLDEVKRMKDDMFKLTSDHTITTAANQSAGKYSGGKEGKAYNFHAGVRSHVKDVHGVWLKDTLFSFGVGILRTEGAWTFVGEICRRMLAGDLYKAPLQSAKGALELKSEDKHFTDTEENIKKVFTRLQTFAQSQAASLQTPETAEAPATEPEKSAEFGKHDEAWLGVRQDTFVTGAYKKYDQAMPRMHVIEIRAGKMGENMLELAAENIFRGSSPALQGEQGGNWNDLVKRIEVIYFSTEEETKKTSQYKALLSGAKYAQLKETGKSLLNSLKVDTTGF